MAHSVKSLDEENLIDSWVDLNISDVNNISRGSDGSQKTSTPISCYINSGKLEKLLWEAQRESCQSSLVGSRISSRKGSPKSPPSPLSDEPVLDETTPCQYIAEQRIDGSTDWIWEWSSKPDQRPPNSKSPPRPLIDEPVLDGMIPCQFAAGGRRHGSTDWIWEWSSKPDQRPPKEWKLHHPKPTLSLRNSKAAKSGLFSTEMLTILIVSNLISVLIGAGIGIYISKRVGPEFFHWNKY